MGYYRKAVRNEEYWNELGEKKEEILGMAEKLLHTKYWSKSQKFDNARAVSLIEQFPEDQWQPDQIRSADTTYLLVGCVLVAGDETDIGCLIESGMIEKARKEEGALPLLPNVFRNDALNEETRALMVTELLGKSKAILEEIHHEVVLWDALVRSEMGILNAILSKGAVFTSLPPWSRGLKYTEMDRVVASRTLRELDAMKAQTCSNG